MALRTDYKDDIPKTENRRYQMINNSDGTVSFVDVTEYTQVGDTFGAGDINATNESVNGKVEITDIVDPALVTQEGFAADALKVKNKFNELNSNLGGFTPIIDETGKITGYTTNIGGADTVFPFKKSGLYDYYNFKKAVFLSKNSNDSLNYNGEKFTRKNSIPCLFIHYWYNTLGFIILAKETDAFNGTATAAVDTTPIQFQTPNGNNAYYAHSGIWTNPNVNPLKVKIDGITYTSSVNKLNFIDEGGDFFLTCLGILVDEML